MIKKINFLKETTTCKNKNQQCQLNKLRDRYRIANRNLHKATTNVDGDQPISVDKSQEAFAHI